MIVLDASALICLWKREAGWLAVEQELGSATISTANLAEALSKLAEENGDIEAMFRELSASGCEVSPISAAHAIIAAQLRPVTKSMGLLLGDRLCLALAIDRNCAVMTADRMWGRLDIGVPVHLLR